MCASRPFSAGIQLALPQAMPQKAAVLLVDDQRFIGLAVQRLIGGEPDLQLHCCEDASTAVVRANDIQPALILQDLVMPGIDGLALVRMYRANPATALTPIVVLSGNEDADSRAKSLAAGANDYLLKLPPQAELLSCIRRHVRAGERGASTAADGLCTPGPPSGETVDRQVIAVFCEPSGQLSAFGHMLVGQFLDDADAQISSLKDAVRRQDRGVLKMRAHSLKGSSLTVGAIRLGEFCRQLEHHVDQQPGRMVSPAMVAAIEDEFLLVRKALQTL
jgi:CheY-like chemotaxis protein/HPt (histidine-containing phosphotransfer) domain-containing protein